MNHIGGRKKYVEEKNSGKKVEIFDLSIYIFHYRCNNLLLRLFIYNLKIKIFKYRIFLLNVKEKKIFPGLFPK